jgi:hypothetical protein
LQHILQHVQGAVLALVVGQKNINPLPGVGKSILSVERMALRV